MFLLFLLYILIILIAFMGFRQAILNNSNVKKLDIAGFFIVLAAATTVPHGIILVYEVVIRPILF